MDKELLERKKREKRKRRTKCIDCGIEKSKNGYLRCKSCSKKHLWKDADYQEKQVIAHADPEFRRKQRESHDEIWSDTDKRERQREVQKRAWSDPELKARHSETLKEAYSDPELRAAVSAKLDEYRRQNIANPDYIEALSRRMKEWNGVRYADHVPRIYGKQWTEELREQIRDRDYHRCVLCGKSEEDNGKKLAVHHINYDKKDCQPENLMSLCSTCHQKTNRNRNFWRQVLPMHFRKLKQYWELNVVVTAEKGGFSAAV